MSQSGLARNLGSGTGIGSSFVIAYLSTDAVNQTGDFTDATVIFDAVTADANNDYNATTGVFTAPKNGIYQISATITYNNVDSTFDFGNLQINTSGSFVSNAFTTCNPGKLFNIDNNYTATITANVGITSGTTMAINTRLSGGTKTVGFSGAGAGGIFTYLTIMFLQ